MKIRRWIALALLALPALALAQSVTQDGQSTRGVQQSLLGGHMYRADSTQWSNSGDGSGNLYTTEANPDRTFLYKYQSIIQNSLFRTGAYQFAPTTATFANPQADSSAARQTLGATHLALLVTYTLDDSISSALLCLEVHGHLTANVDSVSTFKWRWRAAGTSPADTIGAQNASLFVYPSSNTDTLNVRPFEGPVWLSETGPYRALWVPIVNRDTGDWFSAPFTSVRARMVKQYGASLAALTGKASPRVNINIDLVGWR